MKNAQIEKTEQKRDELKDKANLGEKESKLLGKSNTVCTKYLDEIYADIKTLKEELAEANTTMKKDLDKWNADIKALKEKLAEAPRDYKTTNQKVLQLYRTRDKMIKSEIDQEVLASKKMYDTEMKLKLIMEKHHVVISGPEENEREVQVLLIYWEGDMITCQIIL